MNYEQYLDEVTTLITENYGAKDEVAIAMVMRAQADDFFSRHDEDESICTLERAGTHCGVRPRFSATDTLPGGCLPDCAPAP